eukprot:Nitzschia sp. Nitz4//scaffold61_size107673//103755//105104//NITZ4_004258-RA/size107673-processed-gene-0.69-mRNA-1//1//CDS//3329555779//7681//frame0
MGLSRRQLYMLGGLILLVGAAFIGYHFLDEFYRKGPASLPLPMTKVSKSGTRTRSLPLSLSPDSAAKVPHPAVTSALSSPKPSLVSKHAATSTAPRGKLAPIDMSKVLSETNIHVALHAPNGHSSITVDPRQFCKVQTSRLPTWLPGFLVPPPKVLETISNGQLVAAATIAGGITESFRTLLLYPLQTVKTRIQKEMFQHVQSEDPLLMNALKVNQTGLEMGVTDRIAALLGRLERQIEKGNLYAGITPSLLVSVPATGAYYGVRDVCRRVLYQMPFLTDTQRVLMAALAADVISLGVRTPANTLSVRLQDGNRTVGDWWGDSLERLPSIILTDLPYLLSKIYLGRQFLTGNLRVEQYAAFAMISAIVASLLTTPFDVARTHILLGGKNTTTNIWETMVEIAEDDGGWNNLFAGWLERVLYYGIGRAWLDPFYYVSYIGIRDAVLLQWF